MIGLDYQHLVSFAKNEVLHQLNTIRNDPEAMKAAGVTTEQVRAAFEVVHAVGNHYQQEAKNKKEKSNGSTSS